MHQCMYICQEAWFELFVVRTSVTKDKIPGGLSELLCLAFQAFWDPDGHDVRLAGCHLDVLQHEPMRVFLEMGGVLADEAALHMAFDCKGSSGLKPCFLCANIFNKDEDSARKPVASDATGWSQYISCSQYAQLSPMSIGTLKAWTSFVLKSKFQLYSQDSTATSPPPPFTIAREHHITNTNTPPPCTRPEAIMKRLSDAHPVMTKINFAELETRFSLVTKVNIRHTTDDSISSLARLHFRWCMCIQLFTRIDLTGWDGITIHGACYSIASGRS